MPYSLTTPSGQVINDIPDDVPQAEALRQLQMRRPELFSKPTSPYSITTPSGQVINDIPADVPREQALENLKRAQPNLFVTQPTVKPGEEELPSQEQADNQSFLRPVGDVPLLFQRGALRMAQAGVDMFGAGSDTAKHIQAASAHLTSLLSAQAKRDAAEVSRIMEDAKDKGIADSVIAGLEAITVSPVDFVAEALGTAVPALAAAALTTVMGGGALAAGVTASAVGFGTGVGLIKGEIYDAVKGALEEKGGLSAKEIEAKAQTAQEYAGENLDLILAGGGINALAQITGLGSSFIRGTVAARIKKTVGEEAAKRTASEAARAEVTKMAARTMPGQAARTAAVESLGEGAQGGFEQLAQNIALQREGFDVPTMRGVVSSGVLEAGAGAPLGAGAGALEVRQARQTARAMEDADIYGTELARAEAEFKERTRLAELEDILTGNPVILTDEQGEQLYDEAGKPMVSERTRGRELTEEEQTEFDALKAKLIPTTSVPTTPEEQAAAVEAETDRLLKLGYDDADARAQAEANVSFQVAEDEEIRKEETDRVQKRKQFGTIYDAYIAEGYSEEEATRLAVEDLYYETDTETAGRAGVQETADVTGQETGPVTVNQLAREEQKRAGWSEAWPFIPADLGNSDFRQLLRDDPNISPEEKVQIFEAGYKLGVVPRQEVADVIDLGGPVDLTANIPDVKLGQFSPGSTATTTIERDGKTTTTTIPARAVPLTTDLSNTELTRTIERRMDELDAAGEGTSEAAIIQDEISALQKEQRRREAARPVAQKTSKAQRSLFEDEGEGDVGGESAAKPSQTIEDILKSLGPEVQARYEAAAAEAERQRAERRGRGRPALTAEGTAERAAQEKARKRAIADNTRDTAIVKRFTERFKKLYKDDDGGIRDTFASMVEVFGKEARSKIAARVNALKEKEAALITQMYFAYNSMPDSAHRRRLGQLLYSIDENTGRRDKPNPLISPDAFSRAERVFKETREEARQAAAERRTHTLLSKARSLGKKEAEGKNRQVDTINGEFNNVTTVKDALKIVAKTGTPFMKLLAKRISNAVGDAKFIVVERGDKLPKALEKDSSAVGLTAIEKDAAGNLKVTVYVRGASWGDRSQGINNIIVLHEALHAALDKKVWGIQRANKLGLTTTKAERDFYDDIAALMAEARDRFGYMYIYYKRSNNLDPIQTGNKLLYKALEEVVEGAKGAMFNDPQEFIAYALSEPVFENFLNGYKPANSIRSAYGKFVDLVRKLFGFAPNQITALTELVSAVDAGISTKSSRGVVEALQLSLMSPSAAKRAMKSKSDMLKLAKEQDRVAKGYEESDDPTKVNGSIKKSKDAQSGKDAVEAMATLYATGSTKTKRALVRVFTLPLLGDVARRLGLKSVAEAPAIFSKMNSLADNILLGAQETLDNTFRTFQGRPKAMAAFTRLALQSTLLNIDPATNLSSPMLNKLYAALDEKGKQEYIRMRDYFQGMTQMYTRFLDDRVKNLGGSKQEADNVLEKIKAMYEVGDKIYPFFPLKRFGDYWIRIGVGANRKFFTFESEFERDQAVRKFAKKRNMTVNEFLSQKEGTEQYARVGIKLDELRGELLTGEMGQKLRELFDAIDKMDAADPDAKAKLKDDIYQTYLATLPEQSIRRQFMHREGITGYSTDFLRSFTEAATQNAFQLSRIKYGPELRRAVLAAKKATTNQPALATLAEEFSRRVNNNLTTGKSENKLLDWTTSFLTQSSFIYYLSAVASPMLQMFQLGITGFNTLGANYGFAKTTKEIAKLSKVWNQFSVFKKNADGSVTMTAPSLARSKAVQMNDRERRAMEKLLRHDVVRVTLAAEVTELSKIPSKSLEGSFSQSARSIMQLPGKLMQAVEQLAREMLALIAYRLAYEKHGDNETAIEEAAFHVADSMGNYASYARPPFMQGAWGRLAFQFMMFPVQMTGWFAKNFYFSIPFLKTNKEGKHLAFKLWASSLASIWVVAGTSGLPFGLGTMMLGVLSQLFDEAKDDDDFPPEYKDMAFEFYVRKVWLPQQVGHITINDVPLDMIIDYGPLSAFTGVDFASRLSLSNMFIRERKEEATFESELTNRLIGMGGPSLNMIINFVKGLDALRVGDVQKFGEKVAPAALRAPLFAEKYSRQGVVDWEGTVLTPADQVELGKLLAQAIGFRPLELTEQGYRTFTQRAVEQAIQYEKNRIYTRLYRALVTGDSKEFDRILDEDVEKFNEKHKDFRIEEDDIERSLEERLEQRAIKQDTGGFRLNERNAPLILPLLREDR